MNNVTIDMSSKDVILAWANDDLILERDINTGATYIYDDRNKSPNLGDESKEWYLVSPGEDIYVSPFLRKSKQGFCVETFIGPLALKSKLHQPDCFIKWIGAYNRLPKEAMKLNKEKSSLLPFVEAWAKGEVVTCSSNYNNKATLSTTSEVMTFNTKYKYEIEKTND